MHKSNPQYFDGLKFVRISDLPAEQSEKLSSWIARSDLLKLSIDGVAINDCIDYRDYNYWYDNYINPTYISSF